MIEMRVQRPARSRAGPFCRSRVLPQSSLAPPHDLSPTPHPRNSCAARRRRPSTYQSVQGLGFGCCGSISIRRAPQADAINPSGAARLAAAAFVGLQRYGLAREAPMRAELLRLRAAPGLSGECREVVGRCLGEEPVVGCQPDYYRKMPNRLPNFCLIDTKSCLITIWLKSRGPMRESEICVASVRSRIANIPRSI
jgi:hypothetical protein